MYIERECLLTLASGQVFGFCWCLKPDNFAVETKRSKWKFMDESATILALGYVHKIFTPLFSRYFSNKSFGTHGLFVESIFFAVLYQLRIRSSQARESVPACCSNRVLRSVWCGVLKLVSWDSSLARESDAQCCSLLQCDSLCWILLKSVCWNLQ